MSWTPAADPDCTRYAHLRAVATVIEGQARDIGGFAVRRVLPSSDRRAVGPFIFFDEMGPADLPAGQGIDVRPHPHIHLATVTYLFEGAILHRDSVGSEQVIAPGAVNWMTAGRGIVHSERTPAPQRAAGHRLHGLQLWLGLPRAHEDTEPAFHHHPAEALPRVRLPGGEARVLIGEAFGASSSVATFSETLYVDLRLDPGASLTLPDAPEERAIYLVEGAVGCGPSRFEPGRMLAFEPGAEVVLSTEEGARLVLLGGAPLDGPRHMWWNFASSDRARIAQAREDWRHGRFPKVPGDDQEFIPLPS